MPIFKRGRGKKETEVIIDWAFILTPIKWSRTIYKYLKESSLDA